MISSELGTENGHAVATETSWRRGLDVFDDYAGGGVLTEELADDLVNDLIGLVGVARARTAGCRPGVPSRRPGPQPSRPPSARPRLVLLRGGASGM